MAQHDMVIDNAPGLAVRTDINAALQALVQQNSGPVEPATKYPGMLWLDTTVAPDGLLRQRNAANTAWVALQTGGPYLPLTGGTLSGGLSGTTLNMSGVVTAGGGIISNQNFISSTAVAFLATTGAGTIALRPNGTGSAINQLMVDNTGLVTTGNAVVVNAASGNNPAYYLQQNAITQSILFWDAPSGRTLLTNGGGIHETRPNGDLVINGLTAAKPGGGQWVDSSDERIKTVTSIYDRGLAEVLSLQPVRFTYKGNDTSVPPSNQRGMEEAISMDEPVVPYPNSTHYQMALDGTEFIGLVAQAVEGILPEMVQAVSGYIDGEPVDDLRNLDSTTLVYALVNAVKELKAEIDALKAGP